MLSYTYTVWSWCVVSLTVGVTLLSSLVKYLDQSPYTHKHIHTYTHMNCQADSYIHTCMYMVLQHCTHICMHACMLAATTMNSNIHSLLSISVSEKGLHASYHGNIATDSNSSIACLVVAVVSVIQEQLLRRPWTQTSFLPGGCHWQTQAWRVSFLWARREGLYFEEPWLQHMPHTSPSPNH